MIRQISTTTLHQQHNQKEEEAQELIISMRKFKNPGDLYEFQEYLIIHSESIRNVSLTASYSDPFHFKLQILTSLSQLSKVKSLNLNIPGGYLEENQLIKWMRYPLLEQLKIGQKCFEEYTIFSQIGEYLQGCKHLLYLNFQLESYRYSLCYFIEQFTRGLSSCIHLETFKFAYKCTSLDNSVFPEIIKCLRNLQKLKQIKLLIRKLNSTYCDDALNSLISLPLLEKLKIYLWLKPAQTDSQESQQAELLQQQQKLNENKDKQLIHVSKNLKELMLRLYSQYTIDSQLQHIGSIENLQILTLHICHWNMSLGMANNFYSSIAKLEQLIEVNLLFSQLKTQGIWECSYLLGYSFSKMKRLKRMQIFHQFQPANLVELRMFLIHFGKGISLIKNLTTLKLAICRSDLIEYEDCLYNFRKILRLSTITIR